jgi:hypothetical protein
VLNAIYQGDRDLLPIFTHVFFRLRDVAFLPSHTEIIGNPADDLPGVIAQVTPGSAEQSDSRCGGRAHRYPWLEYPGGTHSAVPESDAASADGAAPSSR